MVSDSHSGKLFDTISRFQSSRFPAAAQGQGEKASGFRLSAQGGEAEAGIGYDPGLPDGTLPSGAMGIDVRRTPEAAKIAFPTAGASPTMGVSPAPAGGWSLRSISTTSIWGVSLKRGTR